MPAVRSRRSRVSRNSQRATPQSENPASMSNEVLLLQLQQRSLAVSGSRADREARLVSVLSAPDTVSSSPNPDPAEPPRASDLQTIVREEVRAQVASAVTDALEAFAQRSAPSVNEGTSRPVVPATVLSGAATAIDIASTVTATPLPGLQIDNNAPSSVTGHLQTASTTNPSLALPTSTVPARVTDRILRGEFINFDDLLPEALGAAPSPIQLQVSTSGQPVQLIHDPHPKAIQRRVHDLSTWLEAWTAFVNVILSAAPRRSNELLGYQAIIIDANKKFFPDAWLAYDRQFRLACANDPSRSWNVVDANMWQLTMTGKSRPTCTACFLVHPLSGGGRCPFRSHSSQAIAHTASTSRPREIIHDGREVCRNYNFRRCTSGQCVRAHVCLRCRGSHPSTSCSEPATKRSRQSAAGRPNAQQS